MWITFLNQDVVKKNIILLNIVFCGRLSNPGKARKNVVFRLTEIG
jgi:hypothetical protein